MSKKSAKFEYPCLLNSSVSGGRWAVGGGRWPVGGGYSKTITYSPPPTSLIRNPLSTYEAENRCLEKHAQPEAELKKRGYL